MHLTPKPPAATASVDRSTEQVSGGSGLSSCTPRLVVCVCAKRRLRTGGKGPCSAVLWCVCAKRRLRTGGKGPCSAVLGVALDWGLKTV